MDILTTSYSIFIGFCILFGLLECFYGYRIFESVIILIGFIGGAVATVAFLGLVGLMSGGSGGGGADGIIILIFGFFGGALGGTLALYFYKAGVFMSGFILSAGLAIMGFLAAQMAPQEIVVLIAGIIGGIIALKLEKLIIIISTSFLGGLIIVLGVACFITPGDLPSSFDGAMKLFENYLLAIGIGWLLLGGVGIFYQYRSGARRQPQKVSKGQESSSPAEG